MPPDRELRRMVVELAALRADDVKAVLDRLDVPQRRKVEALLREFSEFGFGGSAAVLSPRADAIDEARLSSWLLGRTDDGGNARMTPLACSTLRDAALRLYPAPQAADANTRSGSSLLGRIKSLLWTGEAA